MLSPMYPGPMRSLLFLLPLLLVTACAPDPAPEPDGPPTQTAAEQPSWVKNAVLYEVFVRSMTEDGTFRAIIPRLDELKAMGVTTLWLMPIQPVGEVERKGRLGSPYSIRDYTAVDSTMGTRDDFKALVDAVHSRGMHLILDWVANHTAHDHPWTAEHPEWYTQDEAGTILHPDGTDWTDVADLNYDAPGLREAMLADMRFWVDSLGVDGFRCDVAGMVPRDFWATAIPELRAIKPLMLLAEGDDPWLYEVGFDLTYAWNTFRAVQHIWDGASPDTLFAALDTERTRYPDGSLRMRFITNHDETSWDEAAVTMYNGVQGTKAAMVIAATLPGVPLLYNGQEVAAAQRMNLFEDEKIDWTLHPELRDFYAAILGLSRNSRAIRRGSLTRVEAGPDVVAYLRQHEQERVLVVVNVRNAEREVQLPAAALGAAMQDVITAAPADTTLTLAPYGFRLFRGMAE